MRAAGSSGSLLFAVLTSDLESDVRFFGTVDNHLFEVAVDVLGELHFRLGLEVICFFLGRLCLARGVLFASFASLAWFEPLRHLLF